MAVNGFANHPSASQRHKLLHRGLIGDCNFAIERPQIRQKLFLQRNISRILRYHDRRLNHNPTSAPPEHSAFIVGRNNEIPSNESTSTSAPGPRVENTVHSTHASIPAQVTNSLNMGSTSAPLRTTPLESQAREKTTRRSGRFKEILDRVYHEIDAELVLDLKNIRKKLNFKSNSLEDGERPAKRQKRDTVRCFCHLTVWDNRDGFAAIPLTTKSSYCRVTGVDNGASGYFVDVELEQPFVVKAAEIRVPVASSQSSESEIIDKYFLELKIIPVRADTRWPPMPVLGKSDGDHFGHDMKETGSEELQGAIVARYTHLPTAPDGNIPLSVFFLHEGRTYRTKYGLQVSSTWRRACPGNSKQERTGLDLNTFLSAPADKPTSEDTARESRLSRTRPDSQQSRPSPQSQPEVCYSFSGAGADEQDMAQEFRNATVRGYRCPLCSALSFTKLQFLQLHLSTSHSKYNFSVQKPRRDRITKELAQIHIKVTQSSRVAVKRDEEDSQIKLSWVAPAAPFDLQAFASGDHGWTRGNPAVKPPPPSNPTVVRPARGYPLAKDVPDFRLPNRKRWKAITLETKHDDDEPEVVYTSISHRAVSPDEDARSETDDEIDNEWQIATHMERLDLIAAKENWSPYKRELTKRWDRHRMEEQLEHSLFLSNSLIRFVRKQREWLKNSEDDELSKCFFEFLARLKQRKVIDDMVVADVNELIFQDPPSPPAPSSADALNRRTSAQNSRCTTPEEPQLTTSANTCPICTKPVQKTHSSTTFCQDPACSTPSQRFHKSCVLASPRSVKGKGKERAASSAPVPLAKFPPQDDELRLKRWSCAACKAGQQEKIRAENLEREEKRRREREIVEDGARRALGSMA